MKQQSNGFLRYALVITGAWLTAVLLVITPSRSFAQPIVSVSELTSLAPGGLPQSVFMPGEGIRYRARVDALGGGAYNVRLVVAGSGWYEVHNAGPFNGSRTIEWGGLLDPLYTSGDAYPGKVTLTLDVRAGTGEPATLRGSPQGYFSIQCPEGLPMFPSESLDVGLNAWDMTMSKDNRFLYVTSQDQRIVTVIDADLWQIVSVIPPNWEEINHTILECQVACPPLDFPCYGECIDTYAILSRPSGIAPADLSSAGQRMVLSDYIQERIYTIERAGSRHWLGEHIQIPPVPPFNFPMNLSDVVANPSNELFTPDLRDNQVFRLNLDPPHLITRLNLRFAPLVGNGPLEVYLDPRAPNQNVYTLGVQVLKFTRTGTPLEILDMELGAASVAMSLNPDPARHWLYVIKGPVGPIEVTQPQPSSYIYFWNLDNPTPEGGSGMVYFERDSLWDIDCIQKGELRGRVAYVLEALAGEVRLLNLESQSFLRGCGIPWEIGVGRVLEDPVRNRIYVTNSAAGYVRYLSGE